MKSHDELRDEIPAYLASRLNADERRLMESHLSACEICSETVVALKEIIVAFRPTGSAILEPHPDPRRIREYAHGGQAQAGELAGHLANCASCALEVEVWKIRGIGQHLRDERTGQAVGFGRLRGKFLALGAAAGLILGVGLSWLLRPGSPREERPPNQVVRPVRAPQWDGPVPHLVLPSPRRGETIIPSFQLEPGAPGVVIAVQPVLPDTLPDDRLRFELAQPDGRLVWSSEVRAADIRRQTRQSEIVTLAVPAAALRPGRFELRLVPVSPGEAAPLLQAAFEIHP